MAVAKLPLYSHSHTALQTSAERLRRIDPVASAAPLPAQGKFFTSNDSLLIAQYAAHDPATSEALWGALERVKAHLYWTGNSDELRDLLTQISTWSAHQFTGEDPWETALEIRVASRDSAAAVPLMQHGFTPVGITGLQPNLIQEPPEPLLTQLNERNITLRQATLQDSKLMAQMDVELLTHDAQHCAVSMRPNAFTHLECGIQERLLQDPDWSWIIEQEGQPAGYLSLELGREEHRSQVNLEGHIGYIQAMYLRPHVRGARIGELVTRYAHARMAEANIKHTLLGYAAMNPRSGPFWCRMGYRPLWTSWQRRHHTLEQKSINRKESHVR